MLVLQQDDERQFRGASGVGIVEGDCVLAVFALADVKEGGIVEQPINANGLRLTRVAFCGLIACCYVALSCHFRKLLLLVLLEHVLLKRRTEVHSGIHSICIHNLREEHNKGKGKDQQEYEFGYPEDESVNREEILLEVHKMIII